ncbi:hypothetical protein BO71DRAFT_168805 [Aspergillus ellipticus CBS 707.79]|uniref:Uncharacterized protein n=1 Tax=Aspergillus ellipticus CBS 707.79 TaxID=1448320 RepID=A0A319D9D9_9EURO|nr:hypothetical protein BO71DRAFT_168805 [Aspergillus ellipticus CBS 707.79]
MDLTRFSIKGQRRENSLLVVSRTALTYPSVLSLQRERLGRKNSHVCTRLVLWKTACSAGFQRPAGILPAGGPEGGRHSWAEHRGHTFQRYSVANGKNYPRLWQNAGADGLGEREEVGRRNGFLSLSSMYALHLPLRGMMEGPSSAGALSARSCHQGGIIIHIDCHAADLISRIQPQLR